MKFRYLFAFLAALVCVLASATLPGLALQKEDSAILDTVQSAKTEAYTFTRGEGALTLAQRLLALSRTGTSLPVSFDTAAELYGDSEALSSLLALQLEALAQTGVIEIGTIPNVLLEEYTEFEYRYVFDSESLQGFMICCASIYTDQGILIAILDMESGLIVSLETEGEAIFDSLFVTLPEDFAEHCASYLGLDLVSSTFSLENLRYAYDDIQAGDSYFSILQLSDGTTQVIYSIWISSYGFILSPGGSY